MELEPERLYLTHYGEYVNPTAQLGSFDQWIDQYVEISSAHGRGTAEYEDILERDLVQQVMNGLEITDNPDLQRLLQHDMRLNAQGLAYWRRMDRGV